MYFKWEENDNGESYNQWHLTMKQLYLSNSELTSHVGKKDTFELL